MHNDRLELAAQLLLAARRDRRQLSELPEAARPRSTKEAEAISELMGDGFEGPVGGWKVGAIDPSVSTKVGLERPLCGRIPRQYVYRSGAHVSWIDLMRPVVEAEIGIVLSQDLPPRSREYTRDEIAEAVAGVYAGIEIPESRLVDDHPHGSLGLVADQAYAGRYVIGEGLEDWRTVDFTAVEAQLFINGVEIARGRAEKAMGHPLEAVRWLANERRGKGGLSAGQVVSTGSLTGFHPTQPDNHIVAQFSQLGIVSLYVD